MCHRRVVPEVHRHNKSAKSGRMVILHIQRIVIHRKVLLEASWWQSVLQPYAANRAWAGWARKGMLSAKLPCRSGILVKKSKMYRNMQKTVF